MLASITIFGVSLPILVVSYMTLLQRRTPQRLMGRVSVAAEVVMTVPSAVSLALGALLVTLVDWRLDLRRDRRSSTLAGAAHVAWWLRDVIARPRRRGGGRGAARGRSTTTAASGAPRPRLDDMPSPLLALPGAVAGDGIDAPVAGHYGSFNTEQRTLVGGDGFVDLSHRDVLRIAGPDRLTWLHNLTTQFFLDLAPGTWTQALVLSPQGHVEHEFTGVDDGEAFIAHTEPGAGAALVEWLERMKFMTQVEVSLVDDLAVMWRPGGRLRSLRPGAA